MLASLASGTNLPKRTAGNGPGTERGREMGLSGRDRVGDRDAVKCQRFNCLGKMAVLKTDALMEVPAD